MRIEQLSENLQDKLPVEVSSFGYVYESKRKRYISRWLYVFLLALVIFLFLPWTQNIRSNGFVTTLYQDERPQELVSQIPGKILKWYVKEGDVVNAGDTILLLGEVKDDYLDPNLLPRTESQIEQNEAKAKYYAGKNNTTVQQISLLESQRELKINALQNKRVQTERKIDAKQAEIAAAKVDKDQAEAQMQRATRMYESGAISKFDYEKRNATLQKANAVYTEKANDLANLKQDLQINDIELSNARQEYAEKIAKAQGDIFTNNSAIAEANEKAASLQVKRQNIASRAGFYHVVAPQAGQVVQAKKSGINEIIKEGEVIVEIVPDSFTYAVELFVSAVDLPLVDTGQEVQFQFDGYPAIIFSGWPSASYGTFSGRVVAVESNRSANGKFRMLIAENKKDRSWPPGMKLGNGAKGFALLKDVPIWYELWRNINGFPPDYYKPVGAAYQTSKEKQ